MGELEKKVKERSKRTQEAKKENETIEFFTKEDRKRHKGKLLSVRVNEDTYGKFRQICDLRGTTANAQLNIMMAEYVLEHEKWLKK